MAKLDSPFSFTGKLGNISVYPMKGSDKHIVRKSGGATKEQMKNDPRYAPQRRSGKEFGGRSTSTKYLRIAMFPMQQLGGSKFTSSLNSIVRYILNADTANERGKRNFYFSRNPKLLEGFNLNETNTFDSIIRNPLAYNLDKEALTATISIPAMIPGINFFIPKGNYPVYSFVTVLGIVPDILRSNDKYQPSTKARSKVVMSAWYPTTKGSPAISLDLNLASLVAKEPPVGAFSVMLSVGIRFGTMGINNEIVQLRKVGAAKILGMEGGL